MRIYIEFYLGNYAGKQTADIAIVKLKRDDQTDQDYFRKDRVDAVIAVIELKFLNGNLGIFYKDIDKMKGYAKNPKLHETSFYV